jgi:16S rRNA processing protein RimM
MTSDDWRIVGRILAAHGVKGEVKVKSFTDFDDRFASGSVLYVGANHQRVEVMSSRQGATLLVRFKGIHTRDLAEAIRGEELLIPAIESRELPEGMFYREQLIGLPVRTTTGATVGIVVDIIETVANDVYVVKSVDKEVLVPAIRDVVKNISVENGIVVEAIAGLLSE